jgi:LAO/AO transport system kinase
MKIEQLDIENIAIGLVEGNINSLSKAITLIESNSSKHFESARKLLDLLSQINQKKNLSKLESKPSIRIAITGSPGVGKSTFIETFGLLLCEQGYKVAVLAIDPSSSITKGSILGDKTRMENLAKHPNSFIRPSASGGYLGGVNRKTRESILLCQYAAYDIILIETVGVGQSEIMAKSMVDFFMLLILPGAGDDLQGIKKGVVELANLIIINKADTISEQLANITKSEYKNALHYLNPEPEWHNPEVLLASSLENFGIQEIVNYVFDFIQKSIEQNYFEENRTKQNLEWFTNLLKEEIINKILSDQNIQNLLVENQNQIIDSKISPTNAVVSVLKQINLK